MMIYVLYLVFYLPTECCFVLCSVSNSVFCAEDLQLVLCYDAAASASAWHTVYSGSNQIHHKGASIKSNIIQQHNLDHHPHHHRPYSHPHSSTSLLRRVQQSSLDNNNNNNNNNNSVSRVYSNSMCVPVLLLFQQRHKPINFPQWFYSYLPKQ